MIKLQTPTDYAIAAGLVGALLLGVLVWRKGLGGAAASVGQAAATAAVDLGEGVVVGTAGAVGGVVGLPSPDDTTQDPRVARWIIDQHGYFEASKWASAGALWSGWMLPYGTGTPPPAGSALARALPAPAAAAAPASSAPIVAGTSDAWPIFTF